MYATIVKSLLTADTYYASLWRGGKRVKCIHRPFPSVAAARTYVRSRFGCAAQFVM